MSLNPFFDHKIIAFPLMDYVPMLRSFALGSLIGATLLNFMPSLDPGINILIALGIGIFFSIGCLFLSHKAHFKQITVLLIGAAMGFGWSFFDAKAQLAWELPADSIQKPIWVKAKVDGITKVFPHRLQFDAILLGSHPVKVRLNWRNPNYKLKHGDVILAQVKLKPPLGLSNPGGFDQEKQWFIERIRALGKVIAIQEITPAKHYSLTRLRQDLSEKMAIALKNQPLLGVIQAMTLGVRTEITPGQWLTFQQTGTSHVVAISGLHVGLVASLCFALTVICVRRSHKLITLFPAQYYGAMAAIIGALIYAALAGFSVPTQRSLIMILIAMGAIFRGQTVLTWDRLALAWIGIAILDPLAPMQMGFWLSFGCVAALIYGQTHATGNKWRKWLMPQFVVFFGLMPLTMIFFHQVVLFSPLANVIAIPWVSFVIVPVSLLGMLSLPFPFLATYLLKLAHVSTAFLWMVLEKISSLPFNLWEMGQPALLIMLLCIVGGMFLLMPKGLPGRQFAWFAFVPLLTTPLAGIKYGECKLTLLDVGQGLATVIQTQHHVLLYDAGPPQNVLRPFLATNHIHYLDKIIISHSDLDHRGGLEKLIDFKHGEVLTSEPQRLKIAAKACLAGQTWEWDGVRFTMLNPPTTRGKKRNDLSCVLKIETPSHSALLTGDIEKGAEKALLKSSRQVLKSSILVVPHHGSMTSSTDNFIAAVAPDYALFPVGFANQYGFPKEKVVMRYHKAQIKQLISWQTGAIQFHLPAQGKLGEPKRWRQSQLFYRYKG